MHGIDPADRSVYGPQALLRAAAENGQVFLFHIAGQPGRRIRILSHHNNTGGILIQTVDRPEWKQLSESCLGCGTCTFVCPTCQCYDIKEFDSGKLVRRFRCWDSCMYSDFTKMSAGQPRPTQLERFRQRFMHKLVYFPDNNDGIFGCVGCGRCLAKCPIHMNIVKVVKTLGEETT